MILQQLFLVPLPHKPVLLSSVLPCQAVLFQILLTGYALKRRYNVTPRSQLLQMIKCFYACFPGADSRGEESQTGDEVKFRRSRLANFFCHQGQFFLPRLSVPRTGWGGEVKVCTLQGIFNRPFRSCLLSLFQNESQCKTFHMKMSWICI